MAQSALHVLPGDQRSDWLDVYQAAALMEFSHQHVRRFCGTWQRKGLAIKTPDGWLISPRADSKLRTSYRGGLQVVQQAGLLIKQAIPERYVKIAQDRANVVEAYWRYRDQAKSMSVGESRVAFIAQWRCLDLPIAEPASVKTLERWERAYRHSEVCELLPKYNGSLGKRGHWSKHAKELFYQLYFGPEKRQAATCYYIMRGESIKHKWKIPSLRSVQRHVSNVPEDVKTLYREGNQAFRAKAEPKIRRDYGDLPAGEHIEGDERTCDFYVRVPSAKGWKRIRPKLTAWIDRRSRVIFGWWFGQFANSDTILASFKRGVLEYGVPSELTIDNGEDYKSVAGNPRRGKKAWENFDQTRIGHCFEQLGIKVHLTIPYTPWAKGHIESFFSTMSQRFDKMVPSYCGNKPENRPDGASKIPVEDLPTLQDINDWYSDFLTAYHERPHSGNGMNGLSPHQAEDLYRESHARISAEGMDYLITRRVGPKRVTQNGVVYQYVWYGQRDPEVFPLRGRKVWLRILPDDADRVFLEDEKGNRLCEAHADQIVGATREHIRMARKAIKDRKAGTRKYFEEIAPKSLQTPITDIMEAQAIDGRAQQIEAPPSDHDKPIRVLRKDLERTSNPLAGLNVTGPMELPDIELDEEDPHEPVEFPEDFGDAEEDDGSSPFDMMAG